MWCNLYKISLAVFIGEAASWEIVTLIVTSRCVLQYWFSAFMYCTQKYIDNTSDDSTLPGDIFVACTALEACFSEIFTLYLHQKRLVSLFDVQILNSWKVIWEFNLGRNLHNCANDCQMTLQPVRNKLRTCSGLKMLCVNGRKTTFHSHLRHLWSIERYTFKCRHNKSHEQEIGT